MGRAGRHLGLRTIQDKNREQSKTRMTSPATVHRVPSLTLTLELIPSFCGHPNILLTQPIGAETSTGGEWDVESRKKNTMKQSCPSPFLSTQDAWPDKWNRRHIRQAI